MSDPSILNAVEDEFINYQAMNENDIPQTIWEAALVGDIRDNQHRMDIIWGYLKPKFHLLTEIALSVLVIPHSNAGAVLNRLKIGKTLICKRNYSVINCFMNERMNAGMNE